jgi:hypothetical protein
MTDSRIAAAGAETIRTRTANDSRVAAAAAEVLSTRTANPARIAAIGLEILTPVAWVVSAHDGVTAIERKHTDGTWRRFMAIGADL